MNNDLKAHYGKILNEKYSIDRHEAPSLINKEGRATKVKSILLLVAASIISIISITAIMNSSLFTKQEGTDVKEMVYQYMAENKFENFNNSRSQSSEALQLKLSAYQAFENQDYQSTINILHNIKGRNSEDSFFMALSYLELDNYQSAIVSFKTCLSKLNIGDSYFHEANLYLVVSYILNDQYDLANQLYSNLEKDSWEFGQLQHIMNKFS